MAQRKKSANKSAARPAVSDTSAATVVSQPSVRTTILWTPALVNSVALQADTGDMSRLAELCDQIIADDRVGELLETLVEDVLGEELTFEKDERSKVGDAEKASELEVDWPIGYDDDELMQLAIWTNVLGVGFAKHERWLETAERDKRINPRSKAFGPSRIVPLLKAWHAKHFLYQSFTGAPPEQRTWLVRDEIGKTTPIKAGDGIWVILTRRGEFRPWANGLWRGLAPWWMLKRYAIQDWGVHSEKASKLVANSGPEVTAETRRSLAKYIYEASRDAVIALPAGVTLELLELKADTREIYNAQVEAADQAFSITILGQNLTSNVEGGSRAAAEVHERKENRKVNYVSKTLAKGLQAQSLVWWAEFNFGDRSLAPYPRWHTEPDEDIAAKATMLQTLADGLVKLKNAGYKLSAEQLEDEYGLVLEDAPLPEPKLAPQPGAPQQQPKPPAPKKPAKAKARFLASGDDADSAPGFVAGQVYADALSDKCTERGADYMAGFVERIGAALEQAESYDDVRALVLSAYADEEDPERLAELVEHGIVLANLAGRHAVDEDAEAVAPKGSAEAVGELVDELLKSDAELDTETLKTRFKNSNNTIAELAAAMLGQLGQ